MMNKTKKEKQKILTKTKEEIKNLEKSNIKKENKTFQLLERLKKVLENES